MHLKCSGIGMEIRYPYWVHIATVVSRPRRKRVCRSAWTCSCGPVGSQRYGLPGWLRWTGPRGVVGAQQYGLPGLRGWTSFDGSDGVPLHGPRCLVGTQQHGLPGLLRLTCSRCVVGAQQYRLPGFLSSTGPHGLVSALQYGLLWLRRWSVFDGSDGVPLHGASSLVYMCGCGCVCGDGCGCGIGMEIRYPYWAHVAIGVSRPRRKHAWRSSCSCRQVGALQHGLLAQQHWTCPCCLVGTWQYKLQWRWTCLPGCRSAVRTAFCCAGLAPAALRCDSFLPCSLLPTGLRLAGDWKGPGLLLRLSALAAALASLPNLCPAWGWLRTLGGLLGRESSPPYLSPHDPCPHSTSPLLSRLLFPSRLSTRGQAMLCPCPPRTI